MASSSAARDVPNTGDLLGGLAATAVLLPQAMAFGVTLFALGGMSAAAGALAGLIATAAVSASSGLAGGTRGLISAPTGPALVLLGGAVVAMAGQGLEGPTLLLGLAVTVILAGVIEVVFGASGGGRLIKYMPYPVVSGFMTGSAVLMVVSQLEPLGGDGADAVWAPWWWLPALVAAITVAGARLGPRWLPAVPGPIAGLLLGVVAFHTAIFIHGGAAPEAWLIGALPGLTLDSFDLPWQAVGRLPWPVIVPAAATLAVLAALDTLLTAVVADIATGDRHDARRELMGQGLGQMLAGGFGGMAAAGTTAATVVAIKSGGGRWVGVVGALVFVLLAAFAGDVGRWLPTGALAGVIIAVAFDVADTDMLSWAMQGRTRQDALIAVLVTAITVLYDLMIAVGVGVVIAVALFIREQIRAPVVHRRSTAAETRSIRTRSEQERALLEAHGDRIILYELRGTLFFGTADRLIDELGADLQGPNWLILHFRRVTRIDLTALRFLRQIATRLHEHGGCVLVCELHRGTGIHGALADAIGQVGQQAGTPPLLTFNGRDEALEFAESALLDDLGTRTTQLGDVVDFGESGLVRDLGAADIGYLEGIFETRDLEPGMTLFRTGDQSDELFLVTRGEVEIRVSTTSHHSKRLAVYGPGSFFGELALLAPGPRAADAVATAQTRLRILRRTSFEQLKHDRPAVAIALLSAICDSLVRNQRWSTRELQRLSEW